MNAALDTICAAPTRDGFGSGGRPAPLLSPCDSMGALRVDAMHEKNLQILWRIS